MSEQVVINLPDGNVIAIKRESWDRAITIESTLHEEIPPPPEHKRGSEPGYESEEELAWRDEAESILLWNSFCDGLEALILAHYSAGVDITTPEYQQGICDAYEGGGNNIE